MVQPGKETGNADSEAVEHGFLLVRNRVTRRAPGAEALPAFDQRDEGGDDKQA